MLVCWKWMLNAEVVCVCVCVVDEVGGSGG